jgi:hypothetical protein
MPHVYSCSSPSKLAVCKAWGKAHNWPVIQDAFPFYRGEDCAIWGLMRGARTVREACRLSGKTYYALDNGYFGRPKYFRVTRNGYAQTMVVDRPADRWVRHRIQLLPRRFGSRILVAESSRFCYEYFGIENWTQKTVAEIKKHTDKEVYVRHKQVYVEIQPDEFKGVHCVVTHSSGLALDALINGVPAIVLGPGAASTCPKDLSVIESVDLPDRERLFRSLAYGQFTQNEFGLAKEITDELHAVYDHL